MQLGFSVILRLCTCHGYVLFWPKHNFNMTVFGSDKASGEPNIKQNILFF